MVINLNPPSPLFLRGERGEGRNGEVQKSEEVKLTYRRKKGNIFCYRKMKLIEISSLRSRNYKKMEIEIGKKKGRRSDVKEEKIRKRVKGKSREKKRKCLRVHELPG